MTSVLALVFALLAPPSTSILDITVSPSDASIYVDGKRVKPLKGRLNVKPGGHTVKVSRSGYRSESKTIKAVGGKVYRVKFSLSKVSSKAPAKRPTTKKPVATKKPTTKKPVATKKPGAKKPTKRPAKRPTKKPVATKKPVKRPSKRPIKKPRTSKKPTVGRRPSKQPAPRPVASPGAQPIVDDRQPSQPSYRGYAIVSFLIGGAAIAGGAYMGTQADESADDFNRSVDRFDKQELQDDTEFQATAANVLYGVGAAGVVLGALLWAAEPDYRYSVAPMPGGGTYVGVEGRF